jgi:excisionase family DNA binding protein
MSERKYLKIGEAAARYHVSRVKLWRLIQSGKLRAVKDPRDERARLVQEEDVARILMPIEEDGPTGRLTPERVGRMDEFVKQVFGDKSIDGDVTELIREEREKRTSQIMEALSGDGS